MSRERINNLIGVVKELFATRPSEAEQAWKKERTRAAIDAVDKIPVADIETMMDIKGAREAFMRRFESNKNFQKRLERQKRA